MTNPSSLLFVTNPLTSFGLSLLHRSTPGQKIQDESAQDPLAWYMRLVVHFHPSFPASYPSNLIYNYILSQVILTLIILVFRNNSLDSATKNKQNLSTSSSALNPHLHISEL